MYPNLNYIKKAHKRISPYIKKTPVLSSQNINAIADCNLFFKCENFQKVGAFKYRGASNAILKLSEKELQKGVATHSSGNHAAALALAAKKQGKKAYIVMPNNAPKTKIDAVKSYGGIITFCEPTLEARESTLNAIVEKTGASFIHPFDNINIIEGQATACLELLEYKSNLDIIIAPVGGGGLLSGTAITAKEINPKITVIGAEPKNADDAFRSFYQNKFIESVNPNTIADGLLTSLSELTFAIIKKNVDEILTVSEEAIIFAMKLVWQRMKIIIEPSSAVALAVVLNNKDIFKSKNVGIILSGGNVDINELPF